MTVAELIKFLKTQPQDIKVAYRCCSEQTLMDAGDIGLFVGCVARPDGWIQDRRPDMPTVTYLLFHGN